MTIIKNIKILLVLVMLCSGAVNAQEWTIPGAVTINVNETGLNVPGTVTISSSGTMTAASGTITVSGNWTNSGGFGSGTGRVVLNGSYTAAQLVTTGGTASSFGILEVTNPSSTGVAFIDELYCGTLTASYTNNVQKLSFKTAGTHTMTDLNVNGTASSLITLAGYPSDAAWGLNSGTSTVYYVDVSYSNQTSGKFIYARESNDGGNNVNWIFEGIPLVANSAATSVGQNSATLNAEVNARGTETTVYFAYGVTSGSYTGTATYASNPLTGVSQTTGTQSVSASLSSLSAGTTYYYRVFANNSFGTSTTGSEVSFATSSPPSTDTGVTNPAPTYISVNSVSPSSGATNVSASAAVSATMSDTINGSSVTTSSFKLSGGGSSVSGSVATSGSTITFTPTSSLSGSTQYTATITTGVKAANAAGSSLSADYSWSFTTEAVATASPTPSATVTPSPGVSPSPVTSPTPESEGRTGVLSVSAETADINDYITITLADQNLNTDTSVAESVARGSALWGGTTLNRRGDHLSVVSYSATDSTIGISHPDGYALSAQSVRIASVDNVYVWMVANTLEDTFKNSLTAGSIEVVLGAGTGSGAALVRGDASEAETFLSLASTSSFVATLDGLDNTVEISPDGTYWVSIPMAETSEDSGTFAGTIGFDYTALRLTTDSTKSISTLISLANGITTLTFPDGNFGGNGIQSVIGTGSVVRISDGTQQQFAEVTSVNSTQLNVTALSNTSQYTPDKTWVQVIGNDMMPERIDTTAGGTELFRIGGHFGATYRVRYNDALGDNGVYLGGDNLAITAPDVQFKTYAAEMFETDNTVYGLNSYVVVTLVDHDLNVSDEEKQSTSEYNDAFDNQLFWNENGLGVPSASSRENASKGYKTGGTAKIVYASKLSVMPDLSVDLGVFGNTIDFPLTETDKDTGTFMGTFFVTDEFPTDNATNMLNVSGSDTVYIHYNDSPDAEAEDNSQVYLASLPITLSELLGVLTLSKNTAYLEGDTIVATVVDSDRNQSVSESDVLTGALKVTTESYIADDLILDMIENGLNTGTFIATVKTGEETVVTSSNLGTFETLQGGVASVIYTDTNPSGAAVTKQVTFSAYDAEIAFGAGSYPLDSYALITLIDAEQNRNHVSLDVIMTDAVSVITSATNSAAVVMFETGLDAGTFVGSILISSEGVSSNFVQIRANSGDTLTVSYDDETTVSGGVITVTDTALVTGEGATPTPSPSPTPTASITPEPSPTPSATPVGECIAESIETDQSGTLEIGNGKSATVVVTLMGENGCLVEGEKISASVTEGGNTVKLNSEKETTDANGEASFIITASSKKTGSAKVQFKYSNKIYVDMDVTVVELTEECAEDTMTLSPDKLTVSKNSSEDIVVTLTGENNCLVEGKKVTATITDGKKNISLASGEAVTNAEGEAAFTVTGKKKGSAKIQFKASKVVKQTVKVEVTEADCVAKAITSDSGDDTYTVEKNKSGTIILTVTGEGGCLVANEKVTATITSGDKKIKLSSEKETTNADGEVQFTVTGKKKGNAGIRFKTSNGKKTLVSVVVEKG